MESTPKTGFFITIGKGLTSPQGERKAFAVDTGGEDLAGWLNTWTGLEAWWSPHTFRDTARHPRDYRTSEGWEAASCIALDLDYSAAWKVGDKGSARADHTAPAAAVVDRLDTALRTLPAALAKGVLLAHHTPRGARLVLLLTEPVTDRGLFVRAAAGAAALVTGWLESVGLHADTRSPERVVDGTPLKCPGYAVDHGAAIDVARMLWTPRATVPAKGRAVAFQRDATAREYGHASDRFNARWLASFAPSTTATEKPLPAQSPVAHPSWSVLESALLRSPGARLTTKGVSICCPIHDDSNASAVVFNWGGLFCSACTEGAALPLDRWATTEGGRALLGEDLARVLIGRVRGETLRPFWRTVGEWSAADGEGWLEIAPPPMDWLLTVPPTKAFPEGRHVLPRGTVGMLAAGGGVGKSMALVQLAVAVATETAWLVGDVEGAFPGFITHNPTGGKVLLALGEENALKARRRVYQASLRLSPEEKELLNDRLVVVPLEAVPVGLMADRNARVGEEARAGGNADEMERLLAESGPWALVILDPLSRFAGMETETDNAAATRFVQVLERFTKAPGAPTVLVSHHTGKVARTDGTHDATASRGSSALTDGARWVATLTKESPPRQEGATEPDSTPPMLKMSVTKNNYGLELWPFWLSRGDGGQLRCATRLEIERATAKAKAAPKATRASDSWGEP